MAKLHLDNVNLAEVEPDNFDPVPQGEYFASIVQSDDKVNSKETGRILELVWKIPEDAAEYAGRQFYQTINYIHQSAQAQAIGQKQLAAICRAVGIEGNPDDSEELHNVPCRIYVKLVGPQKYTDKDGVEKQSNPKNEIGSVKPLEPEAPAGKPATVAATAAPAATATRAPAGKPATGARPWANKGAPASA